MRQPASQYIKASLQVQFKAPLLAPQAIWQADWQVPSSPAANKRNG